MQLNYGVSKKSKKTGCLSRITIKNKEARRLLRTTLRKEKTWEQKLMQTTLKARESY